MKILEFMKFTADNVGYEHICKFLGRKVPYNDEEGTIEIVVANGNSDTITIEDGDYIFKGDDDKFYACIELSNESE